MRGAVVAVPSAPLGSRYFQETQVESLGNQDWEMAEESLMDTCLPPIPITVVLGVCHPNAPTHAVFPNEASLGHRMGPDVLWVPQTRCSTHSDKVLFEMEPRRRKRDPRYEGRGSVLKPSRVN